ncbi:MAG TPA: glycosyltransferase [Chitinophagaceae bacterium]|nr:glycosyltransferase [Chitinophagaceae bacterium]
MKRIYCTVTNDLSYDQRMIRICSSLANAGYRVTLVGRKLRSSVPLLERPFRQKRIHCLFRKGKAFYFEYNTRLLFYLLFKKIDLVCAIDLDTILPCLYISRLKKTKRVYDAHELFCEMKEVVSRPRIYRAWKKIERKTVPKFKYGYTVNAPIAEEFKKMYGVEYPVIRNVPVLRPFIIPEKKEKYILYQGAVNEGRSFETLIPAMKEINSKLIIVGDGNFMDQAKGLVREHGLEDRIQFKGLLLPENLLEYSRKAWVGITLFENKGLSNYYSLANRFFDYIHAGIPQVCVNYPVYQELNKINPVAVLLEDLAPGTIAGAVNRLLTDESLYFQLQANCMKMREELNWQREEKKLLDFYQSLFTA